MVLASKIIIGTVIFSPCLITTTYIMSVISHDVEPFWPYISYTGNRPNESCIFSLGFNLISAIYVLIVFLRYCQLIAVQSHFNRTRWNATSAVFGVMGAIGLSMTGCFQQQNFSVCHYIGLALCVLGTYVYMIYQTMFSYFYMTPQWLKKARLALTVLATLTNLISTLFSIVSHFMEPEHYHWVSASPKQNNWMTSVKAMLEWILFFINLSYFALFYSDFKYIALKRDRITFLEGIN